VILRQSSQGALESLDRSCEVLTGCWDLRDRNRGWYWLRVR